MVLVLVATGSAAFAQDPTATLTWHWRNMTTGAQTPLHPGDSAAIWMDLAFSPPVGTVLPDGRVIRGFAGTFAHLRAVTDVFGTWVVSGSGPLVFEGTPQIDGPGTNVPMGWQPGDPVEPLHWGRRHDPLLPAGGWALGGNAIYMPQGDPSFPPGTLAAIQAGQFPTSDQVNTTNPVRELWRAMFTPDNYVERNLVWQPFVIGGHHGSVTLFVSPPGGLFETLQLAHSQLDLGTLSIPVVPAPGAALVMIIAGLCAGRRQRSGEPTSQEHRT